MEKPSVKTPLWRRVLPFAVAIALTTGLVLRLDLRAFLQHLQQVDHALFLGFCALFTLLLLAADSLATSRVYQRTVCPISFRELFLVRGASYLPSLLNHHVGQAWLTWYLSRTYRAPLQRVAGATLLVYASTFGSLFLFGAVSLAFDTTQARWLPPVLGAGALAGIVYLIVIAKHPRRLASNKVLAPLFDAGVRGHLEALLWRLPHVAVLFFGSWIPFRFFRVEIPPSAAFAYIPILMVIVALPVTPQGVGTRDWFSLHYFARYGQGSQAEQDAAVIASTVTFAVGLSLVQVVLALVLMHRAIRVLEKGEAQRPSET